MSRKVHTDAELRPPAAALRALEAWLDANGLRRVALVEPVGTSQVHVSRVFAGAGYLSATQRHALEQFTSGAITVAMLEGKTKPPARIEPRRRAHVDPPAATPQPAAVTAPATAPTPKPQTTEEAERVVDELAARAMPAAFKLVVQQMVQAKSESERRRCAEILIEQFRGKAKQYERREKLEPPATDDELIGVFDRIVQNLGGSNGTRPLPHVPGGATGDDFGGEGLA